MTQHHPASPPPAAVQAALLKITEFFAGEFARPTEATPDWSDFEWIVAKAVAAMHGVSPLLSTSLRWRGPADWANFLEEQRVHTANRHARIGELLQRLDRHTREEGIAAIALKGVALHAIGLYAAGERPMADVDLLVRPRDAERSARLLESLGYYESGATWKERVFTPVGEFRVASLGEHSNNHIKIELHERICERLPRKITDISEFIFPESPQPGLNAYPSKAALMNHLLLHAAGAMVFQTLRLLQLHDLALLSLRMTPADWDEMLEYRVRARGLWWALPPLQLTLRYYPLRVPARVLTALKLDCPWFLGSVSRRRALTHVSYSHLWVDALPGIEWSRSVPEVLRFAAGRVRPSAQHLALRETLAKTQAWAAHSRWSRLSQTRRIFRWVMSRQTRPVTMHAVRAAFAHQSALRLNSSSSEW
jgi:putative nucleotidyltransferase-like protein